MTDLSRSTVAYLGDLHQDGISLSAQFGNLRSEIVARPLLAQEIVAEAF